jgi:hypothetical protein
MRYAKSADSLAQHVLLLSVHAVHLAKHVNSTVAATADKPVLQEKCGVHNLLPHMQPLAMLGMCYRPSAVLPHGQRLAVLGLHCQDSRRAEHTQRLRNKREPCSLETEKKTQRTISTCNPDMET